MPTRTNKPRLPYHVVPITRGARTWGLIATIGQGGLMGLMGLYYLNDIYYWGAGLPFLFIGLAIANIVAAYGLYNIVDEGY